MENSSYEVTELYIMKAVGWARYILILTLPFSLAVNLLSYFFYELYRILNAIKIPKVFFREILKFFPGFINEIIICFRRSFTGEFEIDADNLNPKELSQIKSGKSINHPLFGKSLLIEVEILDKHKGKIIHIKPKKIKNKRAS